MHKYELVLENHGDIQAEYALQPSQTTFGPKFVFTPESGCLCAGEKHILEVTFSSGILGEFYERFVFAMKGSTETLSVAPRCTSRGTSSGDLPLQCGPDRLQARCPTSS